MEQDEVPAVGMSMLYESDRYVVVCFPYEHDGHKTYGLEIVDKQVDAELFLFPPFRTVMDDAIERWRLNTPAQAEDEAFLGAVTSLAMHPLVLH